MRNYLVFDTPIKNNYPGHIFREIYEEKIYAPYVEGKKDLTILDIGGNLGWTAYYFSDFAAKVIVLEPHKPHFEVIKEMVALNHLEEKIIPVNKAIDVQNGPKPFYHNTNTTMHSLNPVVEDKSQPIETVDCTTMEKLFEEYKLDHVDVCKVDIEGTEGELFANKSFQAVAPKIDLVMGEAHQWDTRNRNQLSEALKMAGFQVSTMPSNADIFVGRRSKQ